MEAKDSEERGRAIVQTLAAVVESMVQPSDSVPSAYVTRTKFEAFRAPGISIRDYLMRIQKYASCSPECFVLALVYIDRLHQMHGLIVTDLNVHRVLITSVVLAAKFFDDHYFNNAYYAKVGGVPCSEMNELEVEFLLLVNFTLHVSTDTYERYYNELANHYIFTSLRNASNHQIRHYVAMDPEQEGQLIYVTDVVPEEPPVHVPPPQQQQQQYNPYQQQQQQQQQHLYGYQQNPNAIQNPYVNAHHHQQQQQQQSSDFFQHHPYPNQMQTQTQIHHHHPQQQQHTHSHSHYGHRSAIEEEEDEANIDGQQQQSPAPSTTTVASTNGKHHAVAFTSSSSSSSASSSSSSSTSASSGIVYNSSSSNRTSGHKRRQSVALGVNA